MIPVGNEAIPSRSSVCEGEVIGDSFHSNLSAEGAFSLAESEHHCTSGEDSLLSPGVVIVLNALSMPISGLSFCNNLFKLAHRFSSSSKFLLALEAEQSKSRKKYLLSC